MLTCHSRYNLKRRVASLPPLSSEYFSEKVLTAQATSSAAAAKASFERTCSACQKTYYSENAYQNHLKSQKHRLREAALHAGKGAPPDEVLSPMSSSTFTLGEPIDTASKSSVITDAEAGVELSGPVGGLKDGAVNNAGSSLSTPNLKPYRPATQGEASKEDPTTVPPPDTAPSKTTPATEPLKVPLNRCMFCNYESPTFKLGIMHMNKFHGMFIPEQQYLVDLEGLIRYLFSKIVKNHECLYCHKLKGSMASIQTHMRDTGHCMIAFETEEEMVEVGQFYDFSSTYSDEEDAAIDELEHAQDETTDGVSLTFKEPKVLKTVICTPNGDEEMPDGTVNNEGWETDSSASSLDSEDITALPIDRIRAVERPHAHSRHSHTDGIHAHAHPHRAVFRSDYELYLPSGRTAGHRSLARYFRQNLHNYPTATERLENRRLIEEASPPTPPGDSRGRELTSRANGGLGMLGVTEAKKHEASTIEKREQKREQRAQNQYQWGVEKRGNSQKHFRDPLLQ